MDKAKDSDSKNKPKCWYKDNGFVGLYKTMFFEEQHGKGIYYSELGNIPERFRGKCGYKNERDFYFSDKFEKQ